MTVRTQTMQTPGKPRDALPPDERVVMEHAEKVTRMADAALARAERVRAQFWKRVRIADRVLEGRR